MKATLGKRVKELREVYRLSQTVTGSVPVNEEIVKIQRRFYKF